MEAVDRRQFLAGSLAAVLAPGALESAPAPRAARLAPATPVRFEEPPLPAGVYARLGSARFRVTVDNAELWLTPNGRYLITGDHYQTKVWEIATGRCIAEHFVFNAFLNDALFVRGVGENYFTGIESNGWNDAVYRVDLFSGRIIGSAVVGRKAEYAAIDPTGTRMLANDGKSRVDCYDCASGDRLWSLPCAATREEQFAFSGDGSHAAIAHAGRLSVVDLSTGVIVGAFPLRTAVSDRIALSHSGSVIAECTADENVTVRTVATGGKLWNKMFPDGVKSMQFLPDDSAFLVASHRNILLCDLKSGEEIRRFNDVRPIRVAVSHAAKMAVVETELSGLAFLDFGTGTPLPHSTDPPGRITGLQYLSNRHLVGRSEGFLAVWDLARRSARVVRPSDPECEDAKTIAVAPDGERYASASDQGISIFTAGKRREIPLQDVQGVEWVNPTVLIAMRPNEFVAVDLVDNSSRSIPCEANERTAQILVSADRDAVFLIALELSKDNRADSGHHVSRFDPATRKVRRLKLDTIPDASHLSTSRDGRILTMTELLPDGRWAVVVRDGRSGVVLRTIPEIGAVSPSAVFLDGRTVAVLRKLAIPIRESDGEPVAQIVDAPTPIEYEQLQFLESKTLGIRRRFPPMTRPNSFAFSPDGRTFASAHDDAPVFLWDIYGERTDPRPKPDAAALRAAWADLASPEAECAFRAICSLIQHPTEALPMLAANLKPAIASDPKRVRQAIAELADRDYRTREAAERELAGIIAEVRLHLQAAFDSGAHGPEAGQRLERLLGRTPVATARTVRPIRAHEVLERIGTPAARAIVEIGAKGAPQCEQTEDAAAALARWDATR